MIRRLTSRFATPLTRWFVQAVDALAKRRSLACGLLLIAVDCVAVEPMPRPVATLQGPGDKVVSFAFTPDGKTLAVGAQGKKLTLWDVDSRAQQAELDMQGGAADVSVRFSPDGRTLYAGGLINFVAVWDVETRRRLETWKSHERPVMTMALSPDGKTLVTGSRDVSIKLWDVSTGGVRVTIQGHTDAVSSVAFSPDGKTLASGSRDMTIKFWDATSGAAKGSLAGHTGWIWDLAYSADGKTLASASLDKTVRLWDLATGSACTLTAKSGMYCVAFSPDDKTIFTGSGVKFKPGVSGQSYGELTMWEVATAQPRGTLHDFPGQVTTLAFTPDGELLAVGTADGIVKLWHTTDLLRFEQNKN